MSLLFRLSQVPVSRLHGPVPSRSWAALPEPCPRPQDVHGSPRAQPRLPPRATPAAAAEGKPAPQELGRCCCLRITATGEQGRLNRRVRQSRPRGTLHSVCCSRCCSLRGMFSSSPHVCKTFKGVQAPAQVAATLRLRKAPPMEWTDGGCFLRRAPPAGTLPPCLVYLPCFLIRPRLPEDGRSTDTQGKQLGSYLRKFSP